MSLPDLPKIYQFKAIFQNLLNLFCTSLSRNVFESTIIQAYHKSGPQLLPFLPFFLSTICHVHTKPLSSLKVLSESCWGGGVFMQHNLFLEFVRDAIIMQICGPISPCYLINNLLITSILQERPVKQR